MFKNRTNLEVFENEVVKLKISLKRHSVSRRIKYDSSSKQSDKIVALFFPPFFGTIKAQWMKRQ